MTEREIIEIVEKRKKKIKLLSTVIILCFFSLLVIMYAADIDLNISLKYIILGANFLLILTLFIIKNRLGRCPKCEGSLRAHRGMDKHVNYCQHCGVRIKKRNNYE